MDTLSNSFYSSLKSSHSDYSSEARAPPADYSASPSQMRIRSLTTKLSGIQVNLDEEKQHRRAESELKIRQLDERIDRLYSAEISPASKIRDAIGHLQETLASQQVNREMMDEQQTKELRLVESSVAMDLQAERQQRKELESKVIKSIDEACFGVRLEVAKGHKGTEEDFERTQAEIRERAARLAASQKDERALRDEKYQRTIRKYSEDLVLLQGTMKAEQKVREETEQTMFKMLEDVATRMTADVAQEREERQQTEETLLRLLEQTCQSVETSLR
ncbi:hypothetical protein J8273_0722 [Carpediemonas membranifera]|uniref:Uncharacterized protein n=1 Tax=Carpediemonas membranifera TaxID=201153 RepID=A0A8J6BCY1_9EUKA|nr:hypothetical protein J8273_0722 [Carpediemonas membranifera]|eukprot:KAG9397592.1 hypothetical protein J8273_0722 [Carpediemonas membranifera]